MIRLGSYVLHMKRCAWVIPSVLLCFVGCQRHTDENLVKPEPAPASSAPPGESSAVVTAPAPLASSPVASASAAPVAPPAPLPLLTLAANETAAVLVTTKVKYPAKPVSWTRFIGPDGKVTSKKGHHLFVDGTMYRYHQREKKSTNPPCDGETTNSLYPQRILRNAELVPPKGTAVELIDFTKADPNRDGGLPTEIEHELVAAVPGYLFVKTSSTHWGCGAHPLYGSEFALFALGANASPQRVEASEYQEGSDAKIDEAVRKFNANVDPSEPPDSLDGPLSRNGVSVTMAYPTFRPRGSQWTVLYTGDSTWAGSYGGWAGYTRSVPVELDAAPARFQKAIVMPQVVATYIEAHEKDEVIQGFTVGEVKK